MVLPVAEEITKTIVCGLLTWDGKVYTEIVPDCTKATL